MINQSGEELLIIDETLARRSVPYLRALAFESRTVSVVADDQMTAILRANGTVTVLRARAAPADINLPIGNSSSLVSHGSHTLVVGTSGTALIDVTLSTALAQTFVIETSERSRLVCGGRDHSHVGVASDPSFHSRRPDRLWRRQATGDLQPVDCGFTPDMILACDAHRPDFVIRHRFQTHPPGDSMDFLDPDTGDHARNPRQARRRVRKAVQSIRLAAGTSATTSCPGCLKCIASTMARKSRASRTMSRSSGGCGLPSHRTARGCSSPAWRAAAAGGSTPPPGRWSGPRFRRGRGVPRALSAVR